VFFGSLFHELGATKAIIATVCVDAAMIICEFHENSADDAVLWIGGFVLL